MVTGFIADAYADYLRTLQEQNFLPFNIWTLLETILLYYFFYTVLRLKVFRTCIKILAVLFPIIWTIYFCKPGIYGGLSGIIDYLDNAVTVQNASVIVLCIFYFYEQISAPEPIVVYNKTIFWIVTSYLLYSAATLFLFIYLRSMAQEEQIKYRAINSFSNVFKFILLTIAMLMKDEQSRRKHFELS